MKVKDRVKFTLCDTEYVGSVVKVHQMDGWMGYISVRLDNKHEVVIPAAFLRVV